jgi:uncharacterized membrane protein AbrB (regulator of aidB expression)
MITPLDIILPQLHINPTALHIMGALCALLLIRAAFTEEGRKSLTIIFVIFAALGGGFLIGGLIDKLTRKD